jgi:hypothetical protein
VKVGERFPVRFARECLTISWNVLKLCKKNIDADGDNGAPATPALPGLLNTTKNDRTTAWENTACNIPTAGQKIQRLYCRTATLTGKLALVPIILSFVKSTIEQYARENLDLMAHRLAVFSG